MNQYQAFSGTPLLTEAGCAFLNRRGVCGVYRPYADTACQQHSRPGVPGWVTVNRHYPVPVPQLPEQCSLTPPNTMRQTETRAQN